MKPDRRGDAPIFISDMLDVPRYRQSNGYYCGPACMRMVAAYYGLTASERRLAKVAGTNEKDGTIIRGLKNAAASLGLVAESEEMGSYAKIRRWLAMGVPVIVNWFSVNADHYSVAVMVDAKHIHLNDPETGTTRRFALEDFMEVWFALKERRPIGKDSLVVRRMIAVYPPKRKGRSG